jgi:hypothetical protein
MERIAFNAALAVAVLGILPAFLPLLLSLCAA